MRLLAKLLPSRATALRVWALGAAAWLVAVGMSEGPKLTRAHRAADTAQAIAEGRERVQELPLLCAASRGLRYVDHQVRPARPGGPKYCWFALSDFRRLYPEYAAVSESDLYRATFAKTGVPVTPAAASAAFRAELAGAARQAVVPPAGVGALMILFGWWLRGGGRPRTRAALTPARR